GRNAEDPADFLAAELAAFEHLRVRRIDRELLPIKPVVEEHGTPLTDRALILLDQQLLQFFALFLGEPYVILGLEDAAGIDAVAEHRPRCAFSRHRVIKDVAAG